MILLDDIVEMFGLEDTDDFTSSYGLLALVGERQLLAGNAFISEAEDIPRSIRLNIHRPVQIVSAARHGAFANLAL